MRKPNEIDRDKTTTTKRMKKKKKKYMNDSRDQKKTVNQLARNASVHLFPDNYTYLKVFIR